MPTEDRHVIDNCLNGNIEAFGVLVNKYKRWIYAFVYHQLSAFGVPDFHDAEDMTQEVFIKAYVNLHTLRQPDRFATWLRTIASNHCRNFVRGRFICPDRELTEDQNARALADASINLYQEDLASRSLHEALDSLSEMHRQVLTLHYLGGMSSKEIAGFIGISPAAVWKRLSRARSQLRKEMLVTMGATFAKERLDSSFTSRVVESLRGTEGVWKTYRYVDGLAGNEISAIMQDREGAIWFAARANGGVSRFDGKNWKTYTEKDGLVDNWIHSIFQDREGAIWFGSESGNVSCLDGESCRSYRLACSFGGEIWDILQDEDGAIWFGSRHSVIRFDGENWEAYIQKDGAIESVVGSVSQNKEGTFYVGISDNGGFRFLGDIKHTLVDSIGIMQDNEGAIWIGTFGNGAIRFDGETLATYTKQDGLASNHIKDIIQDDEGAIWFATWDSGVTQFDGKNWRTYTEGDGLANNCINCIMQDDEGGIWAGTREGISRFDGKSWRTCTNRDGLASNGIINIMQDKEGGIWVGTMHGASRFDVKSWRKYTEKDGLAYSAVSGIVQDREGTIWFSTAQGVSRFDGESWKTYTEDDGLAGHWCPAIFQDREGGIWVGTNRGVNRFDGKNWKAYTAEDGLPPTTWDLPSPGQSPSVVWSIFQDAEGIIWVGTNRGVGSFDGKDWRAYAEKGAPRGQCHRFIQDDEGGIWASGARFDGKSWERYPEEDELASVWARAILREKEGAIWFKTPEGVGRFDGKNSRIYTREDGLTDRNVNVAIQDNEGMIWFGTENGGISRFDGRCFQSLDSRDGLPCDCIRALCADRSGQVWIGAWSSQGVGVVCFTPDRVPPPVYITQTVADEVYTNPKGKIVLGSYVSHISFRYHGISFKTRPEAMKYLYQLVGQDSDWQGPTDQETIEYLKLKPGEYTFTVQAIDRDLNYSDPPARLSIVIPPQEMQARAK